MITYKRVDTYDWVYDDTGTDARQDVSIWRPKDYEGGYYPLGDTAVARHSAPYSSAMMVKDEGDGNLEKPLGFEETWNTKKSPGNHDLRVMRMTAPPGYTCLGHVAILGYRSTPDPNKYRYRIISNLGLI